MASRLFSRACPFVRVVALVALWGCAADRAEPQPRVTRSDQESVQDLARAIQSAPDALAEAHALKRLQRHAADRKYTYRVHNTELATGQGVRAASAAKIPLLTQVTVLRGNEPVYDFTFTPRDNRNLAMIVSGE